MISMNQRSSFIALLVLLGSTVFAIGQHATMKWPEAVAQLTSERTKAETCVALVKKYGSDAQRARGQLTYSNAKADADAVIAGLIVALSAGQQPAGLSVLQSKLNGSHAGLAEFCGEVADLVPSDAGKKDILTDITKAAIEPLLKMLSDGVAALYNNYRTDDALTRRTIQTQLEAARWPAFSEVKAAQ
jgi:ABC-type phosphate transport system substrate-binding protein